MGNETVAVYNPRLLDDMPSWVIENIQAVNAYMKTRGHEAWTIAGVRSQAAHAREVEALRLRAEAAEARAEKLVRALILARDELKGLPRSLGYSVTRLPAIDAAISAESADTRSGRNG